jgi:tetratricopeptide (TPR) repeat protein
MTALSRWFGKKPDTPSSSPKGPRDWHKEIEALEQESKRAPRAFQGTALNKAGDVCLRAGERELALTYYGRAIDALLEDGQREAARGVANKIIRVHPEAIRTLCTLTWLDLAARHMATALMHLRDYVEAARKGRQEFLTAEQIFLMAHVAPQEEFLAAAADALDTLGFAERASKVRVWMASGGSPDRITDPEKFAAHCLDAAVGVNLKGRRG